MNGHEHDPENPSGWERYASLLLFLILFLALGLRLIALMNLTDSVYGDFFLWDERVYHDWAVKLAAGTDRSQSVYSHAPLPAYLMAFIYRIIAPDIYYIRLLNVIFGVLTCWLIYLIGRELAGRLTGLISALAAGLYKPFIFYSIVPLNTALSVFLFALVVFLLLSHLTAGSTGRLFLLGAALGLLIAVRGNALVLAPLIFFLSLYYGIKRGHAYWKILSLGTVFVLGLALALAPFAARNWRAAGKLALTTSQTGFALYTGNNLSNPDPFFRPLPFASPSPYDQLIHLTIEASRRAGRKLSTTEASVYWTEETIRGALQEPIRFAEKIALKTLVLFNQSEVCDHYHIGFISNFVPFFKLPFPGFWLILPLAMAGIWTGARKSPQLSSLILGIAFYSATLIIFFSGSRLRLPLLATLIPLAVLGLKELYRRYQSRNRKKIACSLALIAFFAVLEFLPVRGTDDLTAFYNTHAIILSSRGFVNEALLYWEESSAMNKPYSDFANLSLAGIYYQGGNTPRGDYFFSKITDNSLAAASKYELAGDVGLKRGEKEKAAQAYERSLAINSGQRRVWEKIISIYNDVDPEKARRASDSLKYISSFYAAP